jgi:hypothetical protein
MTSAGPVNPMRRDLAMENRNVLQVWTTILRSLRWSWRDCEISEFKSGTRVLPQSRTR